MDSLLKLNISSHVFQQLVSFWLIGVVTTLLGFLGYLSYTPKVDQKAPTFTSDTTPFIGSWGFFKRRWSFWKNSVEQSKTGHFSFWLGKLHVVGISGEVARKNFLDNHHLDRVNAAPLHGVGPEIVPPVHPIFWHTSKGGHSYFQRRVLDLMTSEHLAKMLPRVTRDAQATFQSLARSAAGKINAIDTCYNLVLKQSSRVVCTDEISDTPELLDTYLSYNTMLMHLSSGHTVAMPWLPSLSHLKRKYCRRGLHNLVKPIVNTRMAKGASRVDDTLQVLIDNGDSKDYIITFFINVLFISVGNAGKLAGGLLNTFAQHTFAQHTEWQEGIYEEIKAAVKVHSTNKNAPLVEQLGSLSLEAWESSFPFTGRCFTESIRIHVAFPMIRQNMSSNPLRIPGTDEVIPSGSFVAYNTGDVHYNENLYPNPTKLDPERFSEGREEFKKETYSYLGWGNGRHRCVGQRWAKLQQNIILAYAMAMYKWSGCDSDGKLIPPIDHKLNLDTHGNALPKGIYCKYVPQEKA